MCGIVGSLTAGEGPDPWVTGALAVVAHRGPDDEGVFADGPVTLGFRRLVVEGRTAPAFGRI